MRDIDHAIARALATEADAFTPTDLAAAEQRFLRRRRRRRFTWFGGATLATAAAVVAVAVFPLPKLANDSEPRPADPVAPSPTPRASHDANEVENPAAPAVVFSRGGDIYVSRQDGSIAQLTETQVAEVNPVFTRSIFDPDGDAIVFERGSLEKDGTDLVYLDLASMEEHEIIADAGGAAFWPDGTGAWLDRGGAGPSIVVGPLFSEPIFSFRVAGTSDPYSVGPIAWDQNNEMLFYGVGSQIYWADVYTEDGSPIDVFPPERLDVVNLDRESYLVAPALSFSSGVDVLRLFNPSPSEADGSFAGLELGTIETLDSGATYAPLVDLSDLGLDLAPARMTLAQAGELEAEVHDDGTVEWRRGDVLSWLVGDGDTLILVHADGTAQELPFEAGVGASVSFRYLPKA